VSSLFDILFVRDKHVCPWYCCFTFDNFIRKMFQNPYDVLAGLVKPGDRVADIGPGQGYFSIPMAKMVGGNGQVVAIDIQDKMLKILIRRAERANVKDRIICKLVKDADFGFDSEIDFALAFWMVHEAPDKKSFLQSIFTSLKTESKFLIAEPRLHVTKRMLERTAGICQDVGFRLIDRPKIFFSRSILLRKD
jgi:ubiquinone/menaquinone biosynthesis C-methylase UbiE